MPSKDDEYDSILLVCGNPERRRYFAQIINQMDYNVTTAQTMKDGLSLYDDERPALVLIDLEVSGGDGYALTEALRQKDVDNCAAIIMVTENLNDAAARALAAGADDCILADIIPALLRLRIQNAFQLKSIERPPDKPQADGQESSIHYKNILDAANDPILIVDVEDGRILEANRRAEKWLGYSRTDLLELNFENILEPDHDDSALKQASSQGHFIFEQNFQNKAGSTLPAEVSSRVFNFGGQNALIIVLRDLAKRREIEEAELEQRHIAEALRDAASALNSSLNTNEIIDHVISFVHRVMPGNAVSVMLINTEVPDTAFIVNYRDSDDPHVFDRWREFPWNTREVPNLRWMIDHRQPFIIPDTKLFDGWVDVNGPIRSYLGAPIIVEGQVIGFINVTDSVPNVMTQSHARQLMAFADQTGIAIGNARLHEAVQRYADELEDRVEERTAELRRANLRLKDQVDARQSIESAMIEERNLLRTLIDNIPSEIYVKDLEGTFILANRAVVNLVGDIAPGGKVIGSTSRDYMSDQFTPEDIAAAEAREKAVIVTGRVIHEELYVPNFQGGRSWIESTKIPLRDSDGTINGVIIINRDMTEEKRAEERVQHIIQGANCLLWYGILEETGDDFHWDIYISSEEAAQAFLPLDVPAGESYSNVWLSSIVREDFYNARNEIYTAIREGGTSVNHELRVNRSDGEVRWLRQDIQIRQLTAGRYSLIGVCIDDTEIRLAERALQRTNEMLELRVEERTARLSQINNQLMEQIQERRRAEQAEREQRLLAETLIKAAAALGETLDLNEVLDRILTYAAGVMPPHKGTSVMIIDDDKIITTLRHRILKGDQFEAVKGIEPIHLNDMPIFRRIHESGPLIIPDVSEDPDWISTELSSWVRSYIGVPILAEGKVIGFLNLDSDKKGQFTEIHVPRLVAFANQAGIALQNARLFNRIQTYATELEHRVAERTSELERERSQLHTILNAMTEGVIYYEDGTSRYINRSLVGMTGYQPEEWLSGHIWEQVIDLPPDETQAILNEEKEMVEHGQIWQRELRLVRKNGGVFDAAVVTSRVTDASGQYAGHVSVIRDISVEKRLEEQRARFIANASHELRTPIANLKTRLYLIDRQPERTEEHLAVIVEVTNHMRQLIEDLLDVSRFQQDAVRLDRKRKPLQDVVSAVIRGRHPDAEQKQIRLTDSLPEEPLWVNIAETRMMQVVTNLISNAIKYTKPDGSIHVSARKDTIDGKPMASLLVEDTGIGIPNDMLSEIFAPFFRVSELHAGSGLGLSISRDIVELHGGTISVESEVDKGTTFTVFLPLDSPEEQPE